MLEMLLDKKLLFVLMGILTGLGVVDKCIVSMTMKRMVEAAGSMSKSNHPLMRLVRAKFEHACMISDTVENVGVFVDKYLYDEDTIDYQMTKIYHESAHNENAHSKYLFASIKGGYTKTNIYHCIRKATNSICIISGQYDENSIEIAKQYQKHVPAIECMCIKDTRHLPQIEQPEGFTEQLDILFSAE